MDKSVAKHLKDNPNARISRISQPQAAPPIAIPASAVPKDAGKQRQRQIRLRAEREQYEKDTKERRAAGLEVEPFVFSMDVEAAQGDATNSEAVVTVSAEPENAPPEVKPEPAPASAPASAPPAKKKRSGRAAAKTKDKAAEAFKNLEKTQEGDDSK